MRRVLVPAVLAGVLTVVGCVSVVPSPTMPDALFSIEAADQRLSLATNLAIKEPESPLIVSGQAMVNESPNGEIRLLSAGEWSERSTRMIQLAVVNSFDARGDGTAILPETGISASYELVSRIKSLELRDREAVCDMLVAVVDTRTRSITAQREITARQTASDDKSLVRAMALKQAAESCVVQIVQFAAEATVAKAID